jgi:hypothetical protein
VRKQEAVYPSCLLHGVQDRSGDSWVREGTAFPSSLEVFALVTCDEPLLPPQKEKKYRSEGVFVFVFV